MEQQMLKDKVAIITGASYGMGRSMAELFAEEGAAVVITARHREKLDAVVEGIRQKGGKAVGVTADVCSTEDTKRVFETALKEFGDVDILINNAGIGEQKMIDETDDDWMMYVMNTYQSFWIFRAFILVLYIVESPKTGRFEALRKSFWLLEYSRLFGGFSQKGYKRGTVPWGGKP